MKKSYRIDEIDVITESKVMHNTWKRISVENAVTSSRARHNIRYRHATMVAMRTHGSLSLSGIGQIFGNDHATVLHAMRCHEANIRFDKAYKAIFYTVEKFVKDALDAYDLRHIDIPGLSDKEMNYESVVRVYKAHINTLEETIVKITTESKDFEHKYHHMIKQFKIINDENTRLRNRLNSYKQYT